ncbi:MAG: VWA domain-containing protein, partial [Terriglobales bacterium]
MASHDAPAEFKVNVRLVLVRTVVRDTQGHAIGSLNKDDFQLFDNGKPQIIKQFAVEQPGGAAATTQEPGKAQPDEAALAVPQVSDRFVIYLFDDVHLQNKYLIPARIAAEHHLATLRPTDHAAIFTTSGQNNLDFTDDRAKLHDALQRLQPRSLLETGAAECPYMTHYIADQIVNMRDEDALNLVAQDLASCELVGSQTAAQALAESAARRALDVGDAESRM